MLILSLTLVSCLFYLIYERITLNKIRESIPLVITVTGTRGKSSVVRMLASVLRESGRRVLAKTTGSQAQMILPDGTVKDVARRGIVSILEQKQILRRAGQLGVDCLVVEIMSIRPENHRVESREILKPDIVLITNVRPDHLEAMGETEKDIAGVLELDLPAGASVFVPEQYHHFFKHLPSTDTSIRLISVPHARTDSRGSRSGAAGAFEFAENLELTAAVTRELSIGSEVFDRGVGKASHDVGKLRVWDYRIGEKRIYLVNAFAANDPESTMRVIEKTREVLGDRPVTLTGLLNLRFDRGDRTVQWIEAMNSGMSSQFGRVHAMGGHANVVSRRIPSVSKISKRSPEEITRSIAATMENDGVLFGFGNIGGEGYRIVEYWQQEGTEHGT